MHNWESVLEIETHKLPWNFEIQPDHQISNNEKPSANGGKKKTLKERILN